MIIKKTDLQALAIFAEQNKHHEHKIDVSHLSSLFSSTLQFDVTLVIRFGYHAARYLSAEGFSVDLTKWTVNISDGPIDKVIDASMRVINVNQERKLIESHLQSSEQYFQDIYFIQELVRLISWADKRLTHFFENYKDMGGACDTDDGMKHLFKIPIAKFEGLGFHSDYQGKHKTREYYERLFKIHGENVERLKVYYQEVEPRLKMGEK